LDVKAYEGDW